MPSSPWSLYALVHINLVRNSVLVGVLIPTYSNMHTEQYYFMSSHDHIMDVGKL